MATFNEIITLEHESEHVLEHDLSNRKNFSVPKIYTAKGDITKHWYVNISFRNPKTLKLQRMKNVYGKANLKATIENDKKFQLTSILSLVYKIIPIVFYKKDVFFNS